MQSINFVAMKHPRTTIITDSGEKVEAVAPVILSASRATDIPAFYSDWFFKRLERGYLRWVNPFNNRSQYVAFDNTRFIVFWSKNPYPLLRHLCLLRAREIGCYLQYTLNDYEAEALERAVPPLDERVDTFKRLVDTLGPGSVVWRFDPLILTDKVDISSLIDKIGSLAGRLKGYAQRLVFSFADIGCYRRVGANLSAAGIKYLEWSPEDMFECAKRLRNLNLGLELATCAERIDLSEYGVVHNQCIDPELISRLAPEDTILQKHLLTTRSDSGQRPLCGCIASKDVGRYGTCPHGCLYCYANSSPQSAMVSFHEHLLHPNQDSII